LCKSLSLSLSLSLSFFLSLFLSPFVVNPPLLIGVIPIDAQLELAFQDEDGDTIVLSQQLPSNVSLFLPVLPAMAAPTQTPVAAVKPAAMKTDSSSYDSSSEDEKPAPKAVAKPALVFVSILAVNYYYYFIILNLAALPLASPEAFGG
jgi:hypothetical protein